MINLKNINNMDNIVFKIEDICGSIIKWLMFLILLFLIVCFYIYFSIYIFGIDDIFSCPKN